mmetsp:Transcript_35843/g.39960  ORF Transcript_35843/g.39960 Transcript_35843/m.39960 type:complete len:396 (+) Transcript_35843:526-1713(+)
MPPHEVLNYDDIFATVLDVDDEQQQQQEIKNNINNDDKNKTTGMKKMIIGDADAEEKEPVPVPIHRHVTFAGKIVKHPDCEYRSSVVDAIEIIPVPHVSEYTKDEKRSMWYTRDEMIQMKQRCAQTVRNTLTKHRLQHHCSAEESLYCCFFFLRGLEKFIDYQQIIGNKNNTQDNDNDTNNDVIYDSVRTTTSTYPSTSRRKSTSTSRNYISKTRRYDATVSVLKEQYDQRVESLQKQGKVLLGVGSGSDSRDPDRIRLVYQQNGKTEQSLCEAQYLAKQDELHVQDYCINECEKLEWVLGATGAGAGAGTNNIALSYRDDDDDEYNDTTNNNKNNKDEDNTIVIDNNIMMNKTLVRLFEMVGVKTLLRKLITPFVEVRLGDIFLGIDNAECFLS